VPVKNFIIPPARSRYLAEIVENNREYDRWVEEQCEVARRLYQVNVTLEMFEKEGTEPPETLTDLPVRLASKLDPACLKLIEGWPALKEEYTADELVYHVRGREIRQPLNSLTLSKLRIPRIALPEYKAWDDLLRWQLTENVPGSFPYTAGVFPLKRLNEDPTRMFAGEGGPERTNKRVHY